MELSLGRRRDDPLLVHDPAAGEDLSRVIVCLFVVAACRGALSAPPKLPHADPADVRLDDAALSKIDGLVEQSIADGKLPGCVVLVARDGKIAWLRAYGNRRLLPEPEPMTTDNLFDLASLTKPIATATSVMLLVERGEIELGDPVAQHIPEFAAGGKEAITIEQLLTHQAGLIADNSLADYADGPESAIERTLALAPEIEPGTRFVYSDVGYIVLGELIRRRTGRTVAEFAAENVFVPLGMTETGFLPNDDLRSRAAPTERRDGRWMQGEVHDPRAFALGGVAGHAGLFSTAEDLAVFAQMLLDRGTYGGVRICDPETIAEMTRPRPVSSGLRALGWDVRTGYSINRGRSFSQSAFGHGGFTGTGIWIDPELDLFVIFLSNRVHPDGKGLVNPLMGEIATVTGEAAIAAAASDSCNAINQ